jgi:hypothetical protein
MRSITAVVDSALLEEAVELIASFKPKNLTQLVGCNTVIAKSLDRGVFEQRARRILPFRNKLLREFVRDFDQDLHRSRVAPMQRGPDGKNELLAGNGGSGPAVLPEDGGDLQGGFAGDVVVRVEDDEVVAVPILRDGFAAGA